MYLLNSLYFKKNITARYLISNNAILIKFKFNWIKNVLINLGKEARLKDEKDKNTN